MTQTELVQKAATLKLIGCPTVFITGQYIRGEFPDKPSKEIREQMKKHGFWYNATRNQWVFTDLLHGHKPRYSGGVSWSHVVDKYGLKILQDQAVS